METTSPAIQGVPVFSIEDEGAVRGGVVDNVNVILNANAKAAAKKGTVYIPDGIWATSQPYVPSTGVVVRGNGNQSSFLKPLPGFGIGNETQTIILTDSDYVTVRDLGFLSNGQNVSGVGTENSKRCLIKDCWFDADHARMAIIQGVNTRHVKILRCISEGTVLAENVAVVNASYCTLEGCEIIRPSSVNNLNGIEFFLTVEGTMIGNRVINNMFKNHGAAGVGSGGDRLTVIEHNYFETCGAGLIASEGQLPGIVASRCVFANNIIFEAISTAIQLNPGSVGWIIGNNEVYEGDSHAMTVAGMLHSIFGNILSDNGTFGMLVSGERCNVNSNIITNNSRGIDVSGSYNNFNGNLVTDTRDPKVQDIGLFFEGTAEHNRYAGNQLEGNQALGLFDTGTDNIFAIT